jgi:hypothetical protein
LLTYTKQNWKCYILGRMESSLSEASFRIRREPGLSLDTVTRLNGRESSRGRDSLLLYICYQVEGLQC